MKLGQRYRVGADFEREVCNHLQDHGYVTIRAAGSKGAGKIDIVAIRPDGAHLYIQCKTTGNISVAEWNRIRQCASWVGATPVLASISISGGFSFEKLSGVRVVRGAAPKESFDVRVQRMR